MKDKMGMLRAVFQNLADILDPQSDDGELLRRFCLGADGVEETVFSEELQTQVLLSSAETYGWWA